VIELGYFAGKTVVVTGAGSGIGQAAALAYAGAGARVHVVDLDGARAEQTVRAAIELGASATAHTVDCTSPEAVDQLADEIYSVAGRVDVLQNGVGALVAAAVDELTLDDWRRSVDVNIWSVINGVRSFVPKMMAQGGRSHLVNIASVAGLVGFPYTAAYSMTKFAVVGLSEVLSAELYSKGIAVTVVCPGMVRSNLIADGLMRLPGAWPQYIDQAYANFAARPEWLARQILGAVKRRQPVLVPSLALAQLWRVKRWSGRVYNGMARELTRGLVRLGGSSSG
jgi:NAD(P)-dependent dehydrogenase (short-subunit alcohol dehydrogenase family)